jgi:hypothetical protein
MFEDRPVLKDRLKATATFSGIAIAAVAGFEMVISGGFDFLTPGSEIHRIAPSSYVAMERAPWSSDVRVIPLSSREPLFAGVVEPVEVDRPSVPLAGGRRDASAPDRPAPALIEEDLYRQIEALYAEEAPADTAPYQDAPALYDEEAPAIDEIEQEAVVKPPAAEEIEPNPAVALGSEDEAS